MTEERELLLLTEIREMLAMDKSTLAEHYKISIDAVDVFMNAKATAIIDCIIDNLQDLIQQKQDKKHYKGIANE